MRRVLGICLGLATALVVSAVAGAAADTRLQGVVGPGFSITLRDAQGNPVRQLDPGQVELTVDDRSDEHNFHLIGPGVDVTTALTVGPGFTISLRTLAGKRVTVLRPGAYTVVARDRSTIHNARLRGAGASRTTGIGFVGTKTWRVVLRNGTLTILCDPHATRMRATVRVA